MKKIILLVSCLWIGGNLLHARQLIKVVDAVSGDPLPYALIALSDGFQQYVTDDQGNADMGAPRNSTVNFEISYLGYETYQGELLPETGTMLVTLQYQKQGLEEVLVTTTRVGNKGVFASQNVSGKELAKQNLGQDLPVLLNQATSVVTSTDAGNGVGYTGIRVRGSDPTRINITINGIPVNDAESQGVYWVNMPDLASSLNSIQIQRGVGTSTNGAGAFGASINLQTDKLRDEAYFILDNSFGSFDTRRHTFSAGTGLINEKWAADVRWSNLYSAGYIDRASTNLGSLYVSMGAYLNKDIVKFIAFGGKEKTYQAWNGVFQDSLKTNRTYNFTGEYVDANGNVQYYKDEADNYWQDNYQLHWIHSENARLNYNLALHYTRGKGYYEQYRQQDDLEDYGLEPLTIGGVEIAQSDLIRRRWLDNHFGGIVGAVNYDLTPRVKTTIGGGVNKYFGDHYGRVIWSQFASNGAIDHEYYQDNAEKMDGNIYAKADIALNAKLNAFIDLQFRRVNYEFLGFNAQLQNVTQKAKFNFFNPKAGLFYQWNPASTSFISVSVANKEPNRNDFTESSINSRPRHEQMIDFEAGYHRRWPKAEARITAYHMSYKDQLILTGSINDVGEYSRINVPKSNRTGLELEGALRPIEKLNFSGNLTLSSNKIAAFTEYLDAYDADFNYLDQQPINHTETDIAFSPNVIAGFTAEYQLSNYFTIAYQSKYVSKQYLDNTMSDLRKIDGFHVGSVRLSGQIPVKALKNVGWNVLVNNVFNAEYSNNGYSYGYIYDNNRADFNYYFPQAGINFLMGLQLAF